MIPTLLAIVSLLTPPDCNGNGVQDWQDIVNGTSSDANGDGIPDECQDCGDSNNNGMLDSIERAAPSGLVAEYWNDDIGEPGSFRRRILTRIDPTVSFDWGNGSPGTPVPVNDFSVRWTAALIAPTTGPCTFFSRSDDGFRLWINGLPVIDQWIPQSATTWYSGTVTLTAGERIAFRVDYYEGGGDARCFLEWQPTGLPRGVVTTTAFIPMTDVDADGVPDLAPDCDNDGFADGEELEFGTAADCNGNCLVDQCEAAAAHVLGYWRFEQPGTTVHDSGPFGLVGTGNAIGDGNGKPVEYVPATATRNVRSCSIAPASGASGEIVVTDPTNALSSVGGSFTVEAWVKLDALATGASSDQRQVLVQRKPLNQGDRGCDYLFCVQGGDYPTAGLRNFGSSSGSRSLTLLLGTGGSANASFWTVTSSLSIEDNQWHYVAAIFDSERSQVTFVLDQRTDEVLFMNQGRVTVTAPLIIGAHTNISGAFNQRLRGSIDEVRVCAGVVPAAVLLQRAGTSDCNGNGYPDSCDLAQGGGDCDDNGLLDACQEDCNGNGIADACELAGGAADCNGDGIPDSCQLSGNDCDGNGIPDDCQLASGDCNDNSVLDACEIAQDPSIDCDSDGTPDICQIEQQTTYRISDSFPEFGIRAFGSEMAWLTSHRVVGDARLVTHVDVMFVFLPDDHPVKCCLWSDPNNDGDPTDAQLLASVNAVAAPLSVLRRFDIPDIDIGPNGTSFFVGAMTSTGSVTTIYPGALDSSGNAANRRSWIVGSNTPIDPNNLSAGAGEFAPVEVSLPFPGKWVVGAIATARIGDCNANDVLDACDIDAGTSQDTNRSGRPDECEDCNENGTLDSVDIAAGTSADCQQDGIPDECQAEIPVDDCNNDGIPDACQLAENDCNGNAVLDECDIAQQTSSDTNGSGIPDECEDCNRNGTIDSTDIATGFSLDCQPDGIPDECQLGTPPTSVQYKVDDGSRDGNYGVSGQSDMVWLNSFTVEPGGEWIGSIATVIGNGFAGSPYEVVLWSDPNGDGSPNDAQVLARAPARVRDGQTSIFNDNQIEPTYVGPVGTSFFAGAFYQDPYGNQAVIPADTNGTVLSRSWVAIGAINTVNLNNLAAAPIYGFLVQANAVLRANGFDGVLPFDCNQNTVPDFCDIASGRATDANGDGVPDQCQSCTADLNGNGAVDGSDLSILLSSWGTTGGPADLNGDGIVSGMDLTIMVSSWGPCTQ